MASEGTSTSSEQDKMEATQTAVNILAQGKRNMVCGEIPTAVNQFQEACQLLSKAYGETAKECAEAYFCYGQALLDLARMENGVLGNALQGVPETDDESTEQKNEQFEKAELEEKERDKIRQDVYDAMSEKEAEIAERKKMEAEKKKEGGETMEVSMDTEDGEKKQDDKDAELKKDEKAEHDKKHEKEEKKLEKDEQKDLKKDEKEETLTDDKKSETTKDGEKTKTDESSEDKDSTEDGEEEEEGTEEEGGTEDDDEGAEEGAEGDKEGDTEGDKAKPKEEEGETTSQDGSQDGENPDDVSNLQLAWEMLELAKLIYKKDESKEAKMRVAESHLKLGEVSLETEQYDEAIKDLNICLGIQTEHLEADNRLLAETHYQLGLAYSFNKLFAESVASYTAAVTVIEARMANLHTTVLDKATAEERETSDFDSPVYKARKEVADLKELVPDIKAKIEDVEDEKKNMNDLKNLAKEALGGIAAIVEKPTASGEAPKPAAPASDISHLIKRKRKSEDAEEDKAKKPKQENGEGDAPSATNGDTPKEEKTEAMETKS